MYYDYWGIKKPPFDNVPDPSMYTDSHASMESAIAETLFAVEEGNECIAVIVGDVGLGKTLSLRIIIDSLDHEKYKIALVTNPDMTFIDLLKEVIGQLTGTQCLERRKINLLEIFNKLLFETMDEGKKVLVFIDEANAMSPANLESLRLLTNMQDDQRNLFTIVLAGQLELAQRLEHPKRANLLQRIGTFNRIDRIDSEDLVKAYVQARLRLAGGTRDIFTEDAYPFLYEYSDRGVPRLINKICKLSLKAGETNEFNEISGEVIYQIGERFKNLAGPAVPKRKPRKLPSTVVTESSEEMPEPASVEPAELLVDAFLDRRHLVEQVSAEHEPQKQPETLKGLMPLEISHQKIPAASVSMEETSKEAPILAQPTPVAVELSVAQQPVSFSLEDSKAAACAQLTPVEQEAAPPVDLIEAIEITGYTMTISIPWQLIERARSSSPEQRMKMSGALAAQILKDHSDFSASPSADPISAWSDIRDFVMSKLK